nr:MAG TPA: hypothetical protein [Caudoviricetes sp.]
MVQTTTLAPRPRSNIRGVEGWKGEGLNATRLS